MTDLTKSTPVRKSNFTRKLVIAEQIVLYTALVAVGAFYLGTQYQNRQVADRQAAIHDALKAAATPVPMAVVVPKS
jgi:hypothetical protein